MEIETVLSSARNGSDFRFWGSADAGKSIIAIFFFFQATQIGRVLDAEAVRGHLRQINLS